MSLENSQYTFHTLQSADKATFQREVDRITKEADHVEEEEAVPSKRGRYAHGDEGLTPQRPLNQKVREVSGTILEVTMENFLCHSNMTVRLNKNITFIVGRNGSGKSAVLTALVVALGGNANNTGRGAALKDFVKHGCSSAKVTCVINNAGPINFKRELYGDTITIVRTVSSQGGSTIRLKSDKGKNISSKMEDLRNMTLALGIQVDNPISILDQNTARHFLNQNKPSDKFDLFMRATNLETLQNMFVEIAMYLDKTKQELGKKERQFLDNNAEVEEARKKYEMVLRLDQDRARVTELKMELLWAQVRDTMSALAKKQKELMKVQKEKGNLDPSVSTEEEAEPLREKIESSKAEIRVLEAEVKELDIEIKEIKQKFSSAVANQKKLELHRNNIAKTLKSDEERIEEYKTEIRSQEQKMLPEHVDERRKQREHIRELTKLLEELEAKRAAADAEIKAVLGNTRTVVDQVEQNKRRQRACEDDIRKYNTQLQGLENEESNLSVFGPCMPSLVRQIENCHQWTKKPVGPLGSFVKVKDPKWTLAVESVMRPRLFTFVVETLDDQRRLQQMIRQTITRGPQPGVMRFNCPERPYDTARTECKTNEYSNVLDMVEITNPIARNMLIDLCKLESILLVPTDNQCFALLEEARNVPRNCFRAHTLKGDIYMPAPNFASYGATQKTAKILQTSRDDLIRDTRQRLQESQIKLQTVQQELLAAAHEKTSLDVQVGQLRNAARGVNSQYLETQTRLESLRDTEQPDTNSVSILKEELIAKEKDLQSKRQMLEEYPAKLETIENEKEALKQSASNKNKMRVKINQRIEALQTDQKQIRDQIDELHTAQASRKRKLEKIKQQEEQLIKEVEELQKQHQKMSSDAQKLEDHCQAEASEKNEELRTLASTKRPVQLVDQDLRTLTKRLASVEKTLGQNMDNFQKEFHEKVKVYNTTKKYIEALKRNSSFLRRALEDRKSLYHTQKKLTCGVVSHQFTRVLRFRDCTGNVKINFERRTLEITVGPIDEGERSGKGTSSLSGGERSYATMAFVIALWNVTELPFYFLDEFDVFMDKVNRQTVLTLLLRFAAKKKGYQFGFLTPLDTTSIKNSDKVLVLKLNDPRSD